MAKILLTAAASAWTVGCSSAGVGASPAAHFDLAEPDAAWDRLAPAPRDLPDWALALAHSLPATTAAQLDLDFVQRTRNPLGPTNVFARPPQ